MVDGIPQEYEVRGSGPVCLALSGGPGIDSGYLRIPLLESQLTMVYPTQIGTTQASRLPTHPHGYTLDTYAHFIRGLVEQLEVTRPYLLGHSAGGFFAQHYALLHPTDVAGLILYDTAPLSGAELGAEAALRIADFAERAAGHPELPRVLEGWNELLAGAANDDEATSTLRKLLPAYFADYWGRKAEFASIASVTWTNVTGAGPFDYRQRLAELDIPTLIVVGRYDFICGPRWAAQMHSLISGSTLVTLENSGHFGHVEEPTLFAQAVADFVTR